MTQLTSVGGNTSLPGKNDRQSQQHGCRIEAARRWRSNTFLRFLEQPQQRKKAEKLERAEDLLCALSYDHTSSQTSSQGLVRLKKSRSSRTLECGLSLWQIQ